MERNLNLASLREYLAFPLRDREATNRFLIGAALYIAGTIIPILPLLPALGYQYQVMQRVIAGEGPTMPAWEDWGRLFKDGLKLFLIATAYLLPGFVFIFGGYGVYMASIFTLMGAGRNPSGGQMAGFFIGLAALFIGLTLGMLLFLLGSLPLPLAASHAIAQDRVSAAFQVGRWWPILRRSLADFVIVWIVFYGLAVLLYFVYMLLYLTVILCLALPLILGALSFYMFLAGSAMFADIYRQSAGQSAPAAAPAQPALAPANGEMIGVETANLTAPQAGVTPESVAQAFSPELPAAPEAATPAEDPHATRLLPSRDLGEEISDPQATRRLPPEDTPPAG